MVGFTLLSRSYYYSCVDEVPAPPFPPDHRQAGERRAITRQLVLYDLHRYTSCNQHTSSR